MRAFSHPHLTAIGLLCVLRLVAAGPAAGAGPLFVERAAELGLSFVHFNGMSGELYFPEMTGGGVAWLDYDRDGDLDAYLVQGRMLGRDKTLADALEPPAAGMEPLVDRLYRNDLVALEDGRLEPRFVDVTAASGLSASGYGMGVTVGDYDGDGWPDLYVTNFGSNHLLRNRGDGTFREVTAEAGADDQRWSVPAIFFDYDDDGRLDLYVGNYVDFTIATHNPCLSISGLPIYCGPLAYPPARDRLLHNRGDGTFEEVGRVSGIAEPVGAALGVLASDFDGDGRTDLYVANDGTPNFLWINRGDGTFEDEALLAGCAVNGDGAPEASMGVDAGDYDGDGDEDLILAHLTQESHTLYLNEGGGLFRDATLGSGLGEPSLPFTGFGASWIDYDLDGWLDLLVVNGAVKQMEELLQSRDPYPLRQTNQLFRNLGGGRFEEVTAAAGPGFDLAEVSRGLAIGDVDNDGDPDALIGNSSGPARLFVNQLESASWIGLRLVDVRGSPALGARAEVVGATRPRIVRQVRVGASYASANDSRLALSLAGAPVAKDGAQRADVDVRWPGGARQRLAGLPAGSYLVLRRPARPPAEDGER